MPSKPPYEKMKNTLKISFYKKGHGCHYIFFCFFFFFFLVIGNSTKPAKINPRKTFPFPDHNRVVFFFLGNIKQFISEQQWDKLGTQN
jgi:hypothetical protein